MPYAELHCRSYFSLLDGASAPEELVLRAHAMGYQALALTDIDNLGGIPRAHLAARKLGLPLLVGAEVTLAETEASALPGKSFSPQGRIVLLALDAKGYARLCRLVTTGRMRHPKGGACVTWEEVAHDTRGLVALSGGQGGPIDRALAASDVARAQNMAARLREAFGDRGLIELSHHLRPYDDDRLAMLAWLARAEGLPRVVTQDARYATADRRPLHDILTCIRHKTTLAASGKRLEANGERHLHDLRELERRFAGFPDALERTGEIASRVRFSLEELRYRFPAFPIPKGETPFSYLYEMTIRGARERYRPMTARASAQLAHELGVIERLGLAGYFLIVWDIVRFCREKRILCQGRGSAANSAVCYALGITSVDPIGMDLLFERFLSEERAETPDIDLDIAHQRREEVIQYIYERYGRERAAMACEVITYRARSAVRDVGKAMGLSLAQVDVAAKAIEASGENLAGLDSGDMTVARVIALSQALEGFPRHLGIHSVGMVITDGPMGEVVPVERAAMEGRTVVQWDKDDLSQLGIIKIDLLGLGILTVIDEAFRLVEKHEGKKLDLAQLPPDDPKVYDMIGRADTIGVFQIESRAQMSFLPRHKPRTFYDLVIEVAIIRPGPIQGEMVHPYLRRRNGQEPIEYAHPSLEPVLRRTLGVPLFQEQGMKLAIVAAGFSPGEADELRRAMGHKRSHERMAAIQERLLSGMAKNGIPRETAERIYAQLAAFADYGFPESHAASFALLVYASAYLKRYHHAAFTAALLNAQPMGFYMPHSLVDDAKRHGVSVLPACARTSEWLATLERDPKTPSLLAVRLGISSVRGVGEACRTGFEAARARAPFRSVGNFARRSGLPRSALERLAAAGGFSFFGLGRREALWQVAALSRSPQNAPLLAKTETDAVRDPLPLPAMTPSEELSADYVGLGLSTEHHPLALARKALSAASVLPAAELKSKGRPGQRAAVAGMVIIRQRPPTAKGMVFITLEDETGMANLVLTPQAYERLRHKARGEPLLVASGKIEREGEVVHLKVEDLERLHDVTGLPAIRARDFH
ncbi:MAG: error-prone DNA polymerase [Deltaproteobacteria bacterium]|nr:error-prone DNA polymerase [Deltaproteobacteria bacterium]